MGIRQLVLEPGQEEEAQKKFAILTLPKGDFWLGTSGSVRCHKPGGGGEKGAFSCFDGFWRLSDGSECVWGRWTLFVGEFSIQSGDRCQKLRGRVHTVQENPLTD